MCSHLEDNNFRSSNLVHERLMNKVGIMNVSAVLFEKKLWQEPNLEKAVSELKVVSDLTIERGCRKGIRSVILVLVMTVDFLAFT